MLIEDKNFQELKLKRDVIVVLAFIASSGKSGFDVLLYSVTTERVNFLELIIRVLAIEMDGKNHITRSQIICKERLVYLKQTGTAFTFTIMHPQWRVWFNYCYILFNFSGWNMKELTKIYASYALVSIIAVHLISINLFWVVSDGQLTLLVLYLKI